MGQSEGAGIGWALVRRVVERLGVESEEGQGSRFWVELRRVRKPA